MAKKDKKEKKEKAGREEVPDVINGSMETTEGTMDLPHTVISPGVLDSVVKIYCTHCDPNYSLPWQMKRQTFSTSSGFVIANRQILTNAHSVENHTVVKVKKRGSDHKYLAKVLSIGNECDLALLTVEDSSFWEPTIAGLGPGPLPHLQDPVTVVGFPIGGENISVTAGVVSRVEMQQYAHSSTELLCVQIDAAINPGNSGGPAMNSRYECVGVAFQSMNASEAENIGYIIPWSVVEHFLQDYERHKRYTGFCATGFEWQRMENPSLRLGMGLKDGTGILVKWVDPTCQAADHLKKGDIVTHFEGVAIANDGTVPYRDGERISFHYLKSLKFVGDKCTLRILRDGKHMEVVFGLGPSSQPLLVPIHEPRRMPEYLVVAGLVFIVLSEPYLRSEYGDKFDRDAPVKLLDRFLHGRKKKPEEQVVVLSQVLDADVNHGYEYLINCQLTAFNGTPIINMAHLAKLVDESTERYLRFDLEYEEVIVLDRDAAMASNDKILLQHCIPVSRSIGPITQSSSEAGSAKRKGDDNVEGETEVSATKKSKVEKTESDSAEKKQKEKKPKKKTKSEDKGEEEGPKKSKKKKE
eukprot:comp23232_c0_seq1/m.37901 comp23232_c0_seq1/g.37901  ORF comp23232_c0_seq1/g.37901 comp23232_c0_seq1/m.37901 type:complete len:582 (-) comp23232_c0_seq1:161-1906(-)